MRTLIFQQICQKQQLLKKSGMEMAKLVWRIRLSLIVSIVIVSFVILIVSYHAVRSAVAEMERGEISFVLIELSLTNTVSDGKIKLTILILRRGPCL